MQLAKPVLCSALAAAASALLTSAPHATAADWKLDSALMIYDEKDGVRSISPSLELTRVFRDQKKLTLTASYDSLSGASPSGASGAAQTVTSPSGKPVSITEGSGLILAPFEDQRQALALNWDADLGEAMRYSLGAAWSDEVDFTAISVNGRLSRGFVRNNLVLAVGGAYERDTLDPVGGSPLPFSLNGGSTAKQGRQQRSQAEGLISAAVILSPRTLVNFALSMSQADGYLTDPYKVITVVDAESGEPMDGAAFDDMLPPNQKKANLYEKRPQSRLRQSLFGELKHAWGEDVMSLSYRFTNDDWDVQSHTLEGMLRKTLGTQFYMEPQLRWYTQSAAYFYRHSLVNFQDISGSVVNVRYASADRRLAAFDALTAGLRLGWTPDRLQDLSLRISVYQQQGDSHPSDAIGAQQDINFFPKQTAWWMQLLYSCQW